MTRVFRNPKFSAIHRTFSNISEDEAEERGRFVFVFDYSLEALHCCFIEEPTESGFRRLTGILKDLCPAQTSIKTR